MKISVTIEDPTAEVFAALELVLRGAKPSKQSVTVEYTARMQTPADEPSAAPAATDAQGPDEPETDAAEVAEVPSDAATPETPDAAPAEPETSAPEPEAPEAENSEQVSGTVEEMVAAMNAQYKPTARLGIEGGQVGKGDEIVTEEGEVGKVAATWRGRALVMFTDGNRILEAGDMAVANATSGKSGVEIATEENLRERATKLVAKKGAGALVEILKPYGVTKISKLRADQYSGVAEALDMELAG